VFLQVHLILEFVMLKLVLGFIAFAGVALYILSRGGEIDMSGEKHGVDTTHEAPKVEAPKAEAPKK
jgi:hypothetical protein